MNLQRKILVGELDQVLRDVVLNRLVASGALPRKLRNVLLRRIGHDIHPTALINAGSFLGAWRGLTVGGRAFVNYRCFFDLGSTVTIGEDTRIGYESMFITCGHEIGGESDRTGTSKNLPIVIGAGCWIGARVTVLPGVTIGNGCVIAAGSVVSADCLPNGLYAGVPAVRKRCLPADLDSPGT